MVMIVMSRNICIKGVSKSMGPNWCINCQKRECRSSEYQRFDAVAHTPPDSRFTKDEYFDNKNDAMCSLFVQNVSWSGQVRLNKVNNFIWNCCNKQFSLKAQKSFAALIKQVASESTPQSIRSSGFPRTIGFKQTDKKKNALMHLKCDAGASLEVWTSVVGITP